MQGYVFDQAKLDLNINQVHKDEEVAMEGNNVYLTRWGMQRGKNN